MRIKRREFLKAGAAAGAVAMTSPTLNAFAQTRSGAGNMSEAAGEWIPNTCQGCTTWCPIEIFVQNGRAVKVRGNQLSKANDGYCCVRGHLILQQIYDPDRIKTPMKRTNPKKGRTEDPKFVPISWDEAMDTIADKIMELRKNNETHKFLLMRGRYSDHNQIFYGDLPKMIGTPNNISHSAICAEVEKMGSMATEGFWGYRDYDLDNMKYLIAWACDPLSSNRQIPNAIRKINKVLENGKVAVIDPRMNNTAAKAQEWMPIKPGTDGAVAIAMAHYILVNGLWNKEFCGDFKDGKNQFRKGRTVNEADFDEKLTNGLVKWWNLELKDKDAAWAAKEAGVDRRQIERIAKDFAAAAPQCGIWYGPYMHPRGSYTVMAIHALNGLVGATDSEGGLCTGMGAPSSSYPKFDKYQDDVAKANVGKPKIDQRGTLTMPAMGSARPGSGVVTNNVANAILAEDPYDIKVAIGYFCNFNFSTTEGARWDKAMAKVPFFVHCVPMFSEMTYFADIVLPSALHHTEDWAVVRSKANLYGHISIQQPVIERMFDVKGTETEVTWLLAEKLKAKGFSNMYDWLYNEYKDPETGKNPTNSLEFALYATKIRSKKAWDPEENKDYKGDKLNGWEDFRKKGVVNSPKFTFRQKWEKGFPTETKKFEFYSETLKKGLEAHAAKHNTTVDKVMELTNYEARGEKAFVPHYETPKRHGDRRQYPFDLIDMKSRLNREGRSANLSWYYAFKKCDPGDVNQEDVIQLNPDDARKLGISDGDMVRVTSTIGSLTVKARLWEGVRPGVAAKCYGQGHHAFGRFASKDFAKAEPRGANFNEIMPDDYDRITGSTARNGGFTGVKIEKV
ncbi:molybdopterin dinucleotide-binding region [Desulfurispirillum indicum S5]|uniref:Molybdopterin dinucleotide-binding region n=1 Tax=Desulfurispirillum indicum (strain ATCC BAA-1389 / DSM 22839 / S5) TaxID=653733 RepID=E6W756_DESIS|nr:molybdopterin-dependent oxidoreductase [Desulfurispirillum indicum]ADU65134.1 molybdopterin dinucleotide-binding region [Desulfurispirillum indicum S5]